MVVFQSMGDGMVVSQSMGDRMVDANGVLGMEKYATARSGCKYVVGREGWKGIVVNKLMYGSKRHSLQAVELSQWFQAAVQIVSNLPAPSNGGPIYRFLGMPAMRTRWMAGAAAHKSG